MAFLTRRTVNSPLYNGSTTSIQFDQQLAQAAQNVNTQLSFNESGAYETIVRSNSSGLLPKMFTEVAAFTGTPTTAERLYNTPVFEGNQWSVMGQPLGGQWTNIAESYKKASDFLPKSDLRSNVTYVGNPTGAERVLANLAAQIQNQQRKASTGIYLTSTQTLNGGALNSLASGSYKGIGLPGRTVGAGVNVQNSGTIIGYDKNTGFAMGLDRGADARTYNINSLYSLAQGTDRKNDPFSNTRFNLGGQMEVISTRDPRHTSTAYLDAWPELYNQYQSGAISGHQLFSRAMTESVRHDKDVLNTDTYKVGYLPRFTFAFSKAGGGTLRGTLGGSF